MRAASSTDWRRWIATFCVVLVAFVMVERAFAADPCRGGFACVPYDVIDVGPLAETDNGTSEDQNSFPAQQHHCYCAHLVGMPPAPHASALVQAAVKVKSPPGDTAAPNGEQPGQDRPPRVSAIA